MFSSHDKTIMVAPENALSGRDTPITAPITHYVNGKNIADQQGQLRVENGKQLAVFGLGCFWGAERKFWQLDGVEITAAGYMGGYTPNPSYEEVCSGLTGHNEVVAVVFDTNKVPYNMLLQHFWEAHNPTQGMKQGNDVGTQYRSGIYCYSDQQIQLAKESKARYQTALDIAVQDTLNAEKANTITTEIIAASTFYFAESYHQQYLAKNPQGYCGLGGLDIAYPVSDG